MAIESEEIIAAMQRLVVRVLDLPVSPSGVDADQPVSALEIVCEGRAYEFDSVDVVEILMTLEEELQTDFLEDPAVTELAFAGTLRRFAGYLRDRLDDATLRSFCERTSPARP